jgi:hypothetical protein
VIIKLLVAIALVEAVAELWTESDLFERLRVWVRSKNDFLGYFFDCGYCVSVWLGVGAAYLFQCVGQFDGLGWWEPLLWGLVIHRGSNIWHEIVSRLFARVPFTLFLRGNLRHDALLLMDNEFPEEKAVGEEASKEEPKEDPKEEEKGDA